MKYNAFISYSQRQDARLASCLETALEKFAKPTFKRRALDIFRDSNDLSASPDLWGKIEEGLDESEYFILLASPKAAQSPWCTKEVDHWLKTKSIDKFLVVLTEGELHWVKKFPILIGRPQRICPKIYPVLLKMPLCM